MADNLIFRTVDKNGRLIETNGQYSILVKQEAPNPPLVITEIYEGGVAYTSGQFKVNEVYVYPKGYVGVNGEIGTDLIIQNASIIIQEQLDLKKQYVSSKIRPR
jgi:hypothetical protein